MCQKKATISRMIALHILEKIRESVAKINVVPLNLCHFAP